MNTEGRRGRMGFWLLLPLLLAAAGCGPGVGGTGTGEGFALDYFGARAASVCTATFASELKCPSRIVIGPAVASPTDGSEMVMWVDDPTGGSITADINASNVEFQSRCEGIRFEGTWGTTAEGGGRFFGHFTQPDLAEAVPATLQVTTVENGLSFLMSDAEGRSLVGPIVLRKADSAPALTTCPTGSGTQQAGATFR